MKRKTGISWAFETWNCIHGCEKTSEGCDGCYSCPLTHNKEHGESKDGKGTPFKGMGLTYLAADGTKRWTGKLILTDNPKLLNKPLSWETPSLIFGDSMYDIFHKDVRLEWIQKIFNVCRRADWHYFQFLTKRSDIMLKLDPHIDWPKNLIMGVSIENDRWVQRADDLRAIGAAKKFISAEPLIGAVPSLDLTGIDQVVVGGESGTGFRPMRLEWVEEILAKCRATGTAFYMKQDAAQYSGEIGRFADRPDLWLHEWPEPRPGEHQFRSLIGAMKKEKK
jgi:protein gp37